MTLFVNMRKIHLESIKTQSPVGPFSWVKSNKFKELILTEKGNWLRTGIIICYIVYLQAL